MPKKTIEGQVGGLGGLSDEELIRVFDYAWLAGKPI